MKIKDLKQMLNEGYEGLSEEEFDELDVLIPMTDVFDGYWKRPCPAETGVSELGLDEDGLRTEQAFVIVSHGFFEEEHGVPPQLN